MNFDLNIDNYTKDELIQIFELPSNFDKNILEIKEAKLKNSIVHNREIDNITREKTINFLNKAKCFYFLLIIIYYISPSI